MTTSVMNGVYRACLANSQLVFMSIYKFENYLSNLIINKNKKCSITTGGEFCNSTQ